LSRADGIVELGVLDRMDRPGALVGVLFHHAGDLTAACGPPSIVELFHDSGRARILLEQIRKQERGEAPCSFEPVAGIAAHHARAEASITLHAVVGSGAAQTSTLDPPEDLGDPEIKAPQLPSASPCASQCAVYVGKVQASAALEMIVDEEV